MNSTFKALVIFVVFFGGYKIIEARNQNENITHKSPPSCTVNDIDFGEVNFRFAPKYENGQKQLIGISYLINKCTSPIGVQVRQVGFDKNNKAISVETFWPASINNIQAGRYDFPLYPVHVDERIVRFLVTAESVKVW
ncbi:hypothetical protein [Serratia fonticola]|uniref:Type 1 fimbria pilin n=1 Tax=Serratia fonticola TaxID=47917 RepID=A0AAW3WTX3_SERFO|nr:hypothetical protein [Serratia fonticola]MBC3214231.1 hypothetical protein [Serratia fonticola]NYA13622.1 hypothetical protein [Serratia fonticola]NYA35082.1 hypothetical protein [Serratia fonticola]